MSILLGNGDGTFRPAVNAAAGPPASSLAVGDFNGDKLADIAIVFEGGVRVLLGNGDGTFQSTPLATWPGLPLNLQYLGTSTAMASLASP